MSAQEQVNILMVDDQPGKLLSYEVMLAELGENLITASSGRQALELLLKHEIAVVLLDVSMPDIDGFELADMIRQHPRFQKIAIIFISAIHLTDLDRVKGYQRGAVDYISVPVVAELLRAKVSLFTELHRKTLQLESLNRQLEQRVAERTEELEQRNLELGKKHQELDAIVQTAPDIVFSRQADGARDYISQRFYDYTGADPSTMNGFAWGEYVHPEDTDASKSQWTSGIDSGENYESEFRMRGRDGGYRWFRARAVPIRDRQGKIVKWYGNCSDIHDSKVLENSIRENSTHLEKVVAERTAALRSLSARLMTLQDDERRRIARELHDGLGQDLAAAKIMLDSIPLQDTIETKDAAANDASDLMDRAIKQTRSLSHLLHPPLLDEVGLLSAVSWYVEGLSKRSGIETELDIYPPRFPRLAPELETAIFRIIQEALTNVFRHAKAQRAGVTLRLENGQVVIRIGDDGMGIEQEVLELSPGRLGVGIAGMKQRTLELGGELRLENGNPGTVLDVRIPYTIGR
ncbi:MAG TPA: PAS domain-containing protein [Terriglobales bacterium]|jgi:PAS domain S-box-containing protein|nr:PAS domain-containing protein [Terriglobales bacterium]